MIRINPLGFVKWMCVMMLMRAVDMFALCWLLWVMIPRDCLMCEYIHHIICLVDIHSSFNSVVLQFYLFSQYYLHQRQTASHCCPTNCNLKTINICFSGGFLNWGNKSFQEKNNNHFIISNEFECNSVVFHHSKYSCECSDAYSRFGIAN